jgi:hypothetical protein
MLEERDGKFNLAIPSHSPPYPPQTNDPQKREKKNLGFLSAYCIISLAGHKLYSYIFHHHF